MPRTITKWLGDVMESVFSCRIRVQQISLLTPHLKRIRFQGDISDMKFHPGDAIAMRVSDTEFRNYTPAYTNTKTGIMDIIFHLHGAAPGSDFIDNLTVGDELKVSFPRGQRQYDVRVKQQVFIGDETSLGMACSFLPLLKSNNHRFQFYFELDDANKSAPLQLGLDNVTLFDKNGIFKNELLLAGLPLLKSSDWQMANFTLTGNAASVQAWRRVLKNNLTGGKLFAKGYWLEGKTGL